MDKKVFKKGDYVQTSTEDGQVSNLNNKVYKLTDHEVKNLNEGATVIHFTGNHSNGNVLDPNKLRLLNGAEILIYMLSGIVPDPVE